MKTIQNLDQNVKEYKENRRFYGPWFTITVISLVAIISFGLGRLSALEREEKEPIQISYPKNYESTLPPSNEEGSVLGTTTKLEKNFLASKNGTRYYLPSCSGAKRITESNIVWFGSRTEAELSGYTKAKNCPGL